MLSNSEPKSSSAIVLYKKAFSEQITAKFKNRLSFVTCEAKPTIRQN